MNEAMLLIIGAAIPFIFKAITEIAFNYIMKNNLMNEDTKNNTIKLARIEARLEKEHSEIAKKLPDETGSIKFSIGGETVSEDEWKRYRDRYTMLLSEEAELLKIIPEKEERINRIMRLLMINGENPLTKLKERVYKKSISRTGGFVEYIPAQSIPIKIITTKEREK